MMKGKPRPGAYRIAIEQRAKIQKLRAEGMRVCDLAKRFGVSDTTIVRILQKRAA